jgi:hypothetical protein
LPDDKSDLSIVLRIVSTLQAIENRRQRPNLGSGTAYLAPVSGLRLTPNCQNYVFSQLHELRTHINRTGGEIAAWPADRQPSRASIL